jgi:hypothetical protein
VKTSWPLEEDHRGIRWTSNSSHLLHKTTGSTEHVYMQKRSVEHERTTRTNLQKTAFLLPTTHHNGTHIRSVACIRTSEQDVFATVPRRAVGLPPRCRPLRTHYRANRLNKVLNIKSALNISRIGREHSQPGCV